MKLLEEVEVVGDTCKVGCASHCVRHMVAYGGMQEKIDYLKALFSAAINNYLSEYKMPFLSYF